MKNTGEGLALTRLGAVSNSNCLISIYPAGSSTKTVVLTKRQSLPRILPNFEVQPISSLNSFSSIYFDLKFLLPTEARLPNRFCPLFCGASLSFPCCPKFVFHKFSSSEQNFRDNLYKFWLERWAEHILVPPPWYLECWCRVSIVIVRTIFFL